MNKVMVVPSFPYLGVTSNGNVINLKTQKWLKPHDNGHGYKQVHVTISGHQYMRYVHRLVAECFIPNPDNLPQVNHKDGNKSNNDVTNLEWCTASENRKHAYRTGLIVITERQRQTSRENIKKWARENPELAKANRILASEKADRWGVKGLSAEEREARKLETRKRYEMEHGAEIRERYRIWYNNLSDEQRKKRNERTKLWYKNMTDEQRDAHNAKRRARRKRNG